MKLKILEGGTLIGNAEIVALDPPMRVATAKFYPAANYDSKRHANVIDGEYLGDRSDILRVVLDDGAAIESEAISIQDWPTLKEHELHLWGIFQPKFDELFADHPSFKAYWGTE